MNRFMHHDGLAAGLFNAGASNCAGFTAWENLLCNTDAILDLACSRLESDFLGQNAKMRKPYAMKDLAPGLDEVL